MGTQWFGESWGAPCCEEDDHVPTPVGASCARCKEPIRVGDQGMITPLIEMVGGIFTTEAREGEVTDAIPNYGSEMAKARSEELFAIRQKLWRGEQLTRHELLLALDAIQTVAGDKWRFGQ